MRPEVAGPARRSVHAVFARERYDDVAGRVVFLSPACAAPNETRVSIHQPSSRKQDLPPAASSLPDEIAAELRRLSHDLSNSLEVIVQTSYLLSLAELKEPAAEWLRMLDAGVVKALDLNQSLREYIREHSQKPPDV